MADPAKAAPGPGRPNQKQRTRKDLLDAAARLVRDGRRPSLEEIAEAALVSRATAYRYFPNLEALLLEACLHVAAPDAATVFRGLEQADPVVRVQEVDAAFDGMIAANEAPVRMMLAQSLELSVRADVAKDVPGRQNRRAPLIEAALAPARDSLDPDAAEKLVAALSMLIGTEGHVVTRDVLQLTPDRAREVKRWAIEALVQAARKG
jgi:AcrR family transcriptional regulator